MALTLQQPQGFGIIPCWIGSEATSFDHERLIEVTSAAQQQVVHSAQSATSKVATAAVESAAKAFKPWRETPYDERRGILMKAAMVWKAGPKSLLVNRSRKRHVQTYRLGSTSRLPPKRYERLQQASALLLQDASHQSKLVIHSAWVFKQPIGPVLSIAPWNGGIILPSRTLAVPSSSKASELSPRTHNGVVLSLSRCGHFERRSQSNASQT